MKRHHPNTHSHAPKMNEPAFLPSHRHLPTLPYSQKNHLPQGLEHAFPSLMPHANKYTLTTKPISSPRLPLRKQPQWSSPRPLAPLSLNHTQVVTQVGTQVSDPAPSSPSNSPPLYSILPQYQREHEPPSHLSPTYRPSSSTSSVAYLQTAAAAVIATHQTHFHRAPLPSCSPQDRFFSKPHNFHFGDQEEEEQEGDDGPAEDEFSRGEGGQGEQLREEEEDHAMERYHDDVGRPNTFAPTPSRPLHPEAGAPLSPRGVCLRDGHHFRMAHNVNAMLRPQPPQQHKQHLQQRQQYDVSDLGHDFVSTPPIEHGRVGLGDHVGHFQEQHNDPPSPPQHEFADRHNSFRPWLPLSLQARDLPKQRQHHLNRYEMDGFHPQPVRSIVQMYGEQEVGPTEHQYQIWTQGRSRTRERNLHSQEEQDDDCCLPGTNIPSQGPQHTSSRQYQQEQQQEEDQAQDMEMNDPSAHQSCIETLSQLEQDLAEMQSRYDALQQECDTLRRSNEQMVMDHVQEVQTLQQEHRHALDELRKRAKKYHEESIQRRKDKESKRLSELHDQLRQVLESNKQFRAKVRALERGQINAEREQREELVSLTGLVEHMMAKVETATITATTTATTTATAATTKTSQDTLPRKQEMETKTPVSGASTTLILSPTEISPKDSGKDEVLTSLKSLHAQKCHSALLQLQTLMEQLPKASSTPHSFQGHGLEEEAKQRRRIKRQSGCSASSGETLVVSTATARKHARNTKEEQHGDEPLARMLLEQQYRHHVEIEQIKQQCVALYRASLTEVRAEMKVKLARMKKTSVPSFHT